MDQYVRWRSGQYHDDFYSDATIKGWYKQWISHLLNRVNTVTGVRYKDDPTIMMWELGNEPRCMLCSTDDIFNWATTTSALVKSLDPDHMVTLGDEGMGLTGSGWLPYWLTYGLDYWRNLQIETIDFGTFHMYPTNCESALEVSLTRTASTSELTFTFWGSQGVSRSASQTPGSRHTRQSA